MRLSTTVFPLLPFFLTIPASAQCPSHPPTRYPSQCQITQIYNTLANGNFTAFLSKVSPTVDWTLMGTHPLAGEYHNRTIFALDALQRLANTLDEGKAGEMTLTHVVGGGDEEWSVQELHGLGTCKNGLKYDNRFAWVTRWNTQGIMVEVRACLDSALVQRAITENESPECMYNVQRSALQTGPVGSNCVAN